MRTMLRQSNPRRLVAMLCFAAIVVFRDGTLPGQSSDPLAIEGFSEPFRTVRVAAAESGILAEILVQEGDRVKAGQELAVLDLRIHQVLMQIAATAREAKGELDAARAEHKLRARRLEIVQQLRQADHANEEELQRAQADLEVAAAQLRAAQEKQLLRELEYEKLKAQLEARRVRSPVAGVVTVLNKQIGEFVGVIDPVVATVVQLDSLSILFHYPREKMPALSRGSRVKVRFTESNRTVDGQVEFVSPVAQAESNTIAVRVSVDNSDGALSAGEACHIVSAAAEPIPLPPSAPKAASKNTLRIPQIFKSK